MRLALFLLLAALSAPLWLPDQFGGRAQYHMVISDSMHGSVNRGSMVVLWPQEFYAVGDVVSFEFPVSETRSVAMLHRIVAINERNGDFIIRGDAATGADNVSPDRVYGKLLIAIPYLGYLGGALRFFPLLLGFLMVAPFLVQSPKERSKKERKGRKSSKLFLFSAITLMLCMPLASLGIVQTQGHLVAYLIVGGLLGAVRFLEVAFLKELGSLVDFLYLGVVTAGLSMVFVPDVLKTAREFIVF